MRAQVFACIALHLIMVCGTAHADTTFGQIQLKDGSLLHGEIITMVNGTLKAKASFSTGKPIPIVWSEVTGLTTNDSIILVLKNGVTLQGIAQLGEPGTIQLSTDLIKVTIPILVETVVAINPPKKQPVTYKGNINFGGSITAGNSDLKQGNFLGELVIRGDILRLSLLGRWNYSEDSGSIITRNTFGNIKLDLFLTQRFYLFTSALFEQDTFQDIQLRTSVSGGPGYQFIMKDDFSSPYLRNMELDGEVGLGFFNEDFKIAKDEQYFTGRWATNLDWPVTPDVTIFHQHQGFPSLEDFTDFYITSQQGIRIKIMGNFTTGFQLNWRYDNTPSTGKKASDFQYLLNLGYTFNS
jgi:putative salt-induced outer membrane protein YdiY